MERALVWSATVLGVILTLTILAGAPAGASPGDLLGTVTLPGNGCSVAGTFDGEYYMTTETGCAHSNILTYSPPAGGDGAATLVSTKSVVDSEGNAVWMSVLSWDVTREILWGGEESTFGIWEIAYGDPTANGSVTATFRFTAAVEAGDEGHPDGLAYDESDDTLYYSPNSACHVYHYSLGTGSNPALGMLINRLDPTNSSGTTLCSFDPSSDNYHISGVEVAFNDTLYIGRDGLGEIWRIEKDTGAFTSGFATTSGRVEDLVCDTDTYAPSEAILAKDAFNGLYEAFEVEDGGCLGGPLVNITIKSNPSGLMVIAGKVTYTTPATFACSSRRTVEAPAPQFFDEVRYVFANWSDGATQKRRINCTADATLLVNFSREFGVTIFTDPAGIDVLLDGRNVPGGRVNWLAEGTSHTIEAGATQALNDTNWRFFAWSDGGARNHTITATSPMNLTATFEAFEYAFLFLTDPPGLMVKVDGNEYVTPMTAWWEFGSSHNVEAIGPQYTTAETRWVFASWSDGRTVSHTVSADSPANLTASYSVEYRVIVETSPEPLKVIVEAAEYFGGGTFWWPEKRFHPIDVPAGIQPSAAGNTRYSFGSWSDGAPRQHWIYTNAPKNVTAFFDPSEYLVSLASNPPGLSFSVNGTPVTSPYSLWWPVNGSLTLAVAAPQGSGSTRYVFEGWSDGGLRNRTLRVAGPTDLVVTFASEFEAALSSSTGGGGALVDGARVDLPATLWWRAGSQHEVGIVLPSSPDSRTRFVFVSWSDGGAQTHSIDVVGPTNLELTFAREFLLTASSVRAAPLCDAADCWYAEGTTSEVVVPDTVEGLAGTRYVFVGWSGDSNGDAPRLRILMDSAKDVTANWRTQFYLTLESAHGAPTGQGWYYDGDTAVVSLVPLNVTAAGKSYRFESWSGGVNSPNADVTVTMDSPKKLVAVWTELSPQAPPPTGGGAGPAGGFDAGVLLLPLLALAAIVPLAVVALRRRGRTRESAGPGAPPPVEPNPVTPGVAPPASSTSATIELDLMPCPQCGAGVMVGAVRCTACGLELVWS